MPSDWSVMLIKGLSFHVKVRSMGKARARRNSWKMRDGGTWRQLGGTQRPARGSGLYSGCQETMSSARLEALEGVVFLKGSPSVI